MNVRTGLAEALRAARNAKGLSQEDFSEVSSRTYLSTLERGLKSPTLEKLCQLAGVLDIHPLTLLTLAFSASEQCASSELLARVQTELDSFRQAMTEKNQ